MTDPVDPILIAQLERDEGCTLTAIPDPLSPLAKWARAVRGRTIHDFAARGLSGAPWTIFYGHTGPEVHDGYSGTQAQADATLIADVALHNALLQRVLPWSTTLDQPRLRVLQNMIFNMGWDNPKTPRLEGLSGFVHFLADVRAGRWDAAAADGLASAWAHETGGRAQRLMQTLRTGVDA